MTGLRQIGIATTLFVTVIAGCATPIGQAGLAPTISAMSQPIQRLSPDLAPPDGKRPVTMFSYIAMDDGLSSFAELYLNALESTANARVNTLAFADLQGGDSSFLFKIQPDRDGRKISSQRSFLSPTQKEVAANDPAVVAATVNWAFSTYESPFRAMTMFAHGGGYLGLGTDETQPGKKDPKQIMSVSEFGNALRTGLKGRKLHVMNMLSCLMGNVEYAYELKDVSEVLIASEDSIMATDDTTANFTAEFQRQLGGTDLDARAIGKRMAIYGNAKSDKSGYLTISAIDLTKMDEIRRTVNVLSNSLLRAMPTRKAEIVKAYDAVPKLQLDEMGQRDLWNFCNQVQSVSDPAVRNAGLDVKTSLRQVLLHTRDKEGAAANGLSICMPPRAALAQLTKHPLYAATLQSKFAKATAWGDFIGAMAK